MFRSDVDDELRQSEEMHADGFLLLALATWDQCHDESETERRAPLFSSLSFVERQLLAMSLHNVESTYEK